MLFAMAILHKVLCYHISHYLSPEMGVALEPFDDILNISLEGADDGVELNDNLHDILVLTDDLMQWLDHSSRLHDRALLAIIGCSTLSFLLQIGGSVT